jgi:hypothetical protein
MPSEKEYRIKYYKERAKMWRLLYHRSKEDMKELNRELDYWKKVANNTKHIDNINN